MARKEPPRTPDDAKPEEFGRFEALARKLIKVSKPELDDKLNKRKPDARSNQPR